MTQWILCNRSRGRLLSRVLCRHCQKVTARKAFPEQASVDVPSPAIISSRWPLGAGGMGKLGQCFPCPALCKWIKFWIK